MEKDANGSRKSFLKLTAHYTKNGNDFLLCEGELKKAAQTVNETAEINDGLINPIEDCQEKYDIIDELHATAASNAAGVVISKIQHFYDVPYFNIVCKDDSYTIYIFEDKIYYRNTSSFDSICDNIERHIYNPAMLMFDYDNQTLPLDYFDITDIDSANDLIHTLLICNKMDENIKVKAPKLGCDGDRDDSKLYDDALHGTKEQRDFEDKVEKETQMAGIDNPLAPLQPAQPESVQYQEGNMLQESKNETTEKMKETYEYNIGDWVIIKDTEMKAQVNNIIFDANGDIALFTILASNGIAYDLDSLDEIKPDPAYMDNIPGRVINSQNLTVPRLGMFDIDPDTRMPKPLTNDEIPENCHRDLNGQGVFVYVLKDGRKLCELPFVASFEDIAKSKKIIRVMDESEAMHEYDVNKDIEFAEMPFAAVVDSNGKPIRSIQIDPKSYINADENGEVICKVDGKLTKFPKSRINLLS